MTTPPATLFPQRPDGVRKELARLYHALVRETEQPKCDALEARIAELEEKSAD